MEIRAYTPADRDGCLAVLDSIGGNHGAEFAAYLDTDPAYFVAEHDGQIVACGGVAPGRLEWGMVHARFRRQGVGRFLLFYRLREVSKLGPVEHVQVSVPPEAATFYLGQGFREAGTDGDRIRLSKRLTVCN